MVSVSSLLNCQNIYTDALQIHVEVMYEYATLLGLIVRPITGTPPLEEI